MEKLGNEVERVLEMKEVQTVFCWVFAGIVGSIIVKYMALYLLW